MRPRPAVAWSVSLVTASVVTASLLAPASAAPAASPDPAADARVAAAVAALPALVTAAMQQTKAPGAAVAVVHHGQMIYAEGFGVRDVDTGEPVTAETVFQLASVSKSVGAVVVAAAMGDGDVDWDTKVRTLMPWFELKSSYVTKNATIGDYYTMISGLPKAAGDVLETVGYSRRQILQRLRYLSLTPFRTEHQYTNFGITAGAQAVSEAAGVPWATLSQRLLYGPLGMASTSSRYSDFLGRQNRAALHVLLDGRMQSIYTRDPDAQSPAGGVSSNVVDLSRWMEMELGDGVFRGARIASSGALADAQTAHSRTTPVGEASDVPRFYGYGMGVTTGDINDMRLTHSGAFTQGAGTTYLMIPSLDVGIVVLSNAMVGMPEIVAAQFADLVEVGTITKDWAAFFIPMFQSYYAPNPLFTPDRRPVDPAPARAKSKYVGTYANAYWGEARVENRGGRLVLILGPDRGRVPLEHWDGDEFVGTFGFGQDWPFRAAVTFEGGGKGKAAAVDIDLGPSQLSPLDRVS